MSLMTKRYLEVVDLESGATVHQVEIKPDKSERSVERIMRGMLINMRDGLFIRDTKDNEIECHDCEGQGCGTDWEGYQWECETCDGTGLVQP
jgi:DnaJ-class molecular chaperone